MGHGLHGYCIIFNGFRLVALIGCGMDAVRVLLATKINQISVQCQLECLGFTVCLCTFNLGDVNLYDVVRDSEFYIWARCAHWLLMRKSLPS